MEMYSKVNSIKDSILMPWKVLAEQIPTINYLWKNKGLQATYNFVFVKLFVRGEDCGIAIQDPIWRRFPWMAPYPWMFELEVTTKCNLRCIMCEHTHWAKTEPSLDKNLSFKDFKKIIDQVHGLKWINVTGEGTSFMNPDFMKMLNYLKSKNIFVVFVDHFLDMPEERMRELIKLGIDRIWISVDGATAQTYNKIRPGGDFDTAIKNIKRFIQIKQEMKSPIPELGFRYTFMKPNHHEMVDFVKLVSTLGPKEWIGNKPMVEFVALLEFENTKPLIYEPTRKDNIDVKKASHKYGIKAKLSHPSHDPEKKRKMSQCVAWSEPYIMIGGDLVSCCAIMMSNSRDFLKQNKFGNVLERPFKEIWNSERYKKFRKLVPKKEGEVPILCDGCRAFDTTFRSNEYGVSKKI